MSDYPPEQPGPPVLTPREWDEQTVARAIEKVRVPGVLMVVLSVLLTFHATLVVLNSFTLDQQFEQAFEKVDKDEKRTPEQKEDLKAGMTKAKDFFKVAAPVCGVTWGLLVPVICLGAVKMMRLSNRPLAYLGAIVVMTPFTAGCCSILGLPIGIWALTALSNPDVKAAFEIVRASRVKATQNPDGY